MNYGLTPQGFIRKPYETLLSELQAMAQSSEYFGESIDLSDESPLGAEIKLMAWAIGKQWQLAEDVYYSFDIDVAEGVALNRLTKLGLVNRKDELASGGYLKFSGDPLVSVGIGTQAETEQGVVFQTTVIGQTDSDGNATIAAECTEAGATGIVAAGSITKIKTPVSGITSVTNPLSFTGGRSVETDYELNERYSESQVASGSSLDAIRAKVLNISDVSEAIGYENVENYEDENGLPAKSIELIVSGGDDDEIAETILAQKSGGISTNGNTSRTGSDSQGKNHTIKFSRPEEVQVYVLYVLSINSNFETSSEDQIKTTAADFINGLTIAATVYGWKLCGLLQDFEGIENVRAYVGVASDAVSSEKIVPDIRQILKSSTAKVVIQYE
jgi:uncharacterized phage protein gp47/JayE